MMTILKNKKLLTIFATAISAISLFAQSKLYEQHFDLNQVKLNDGPFKKALDINNKLLLEYDANRLLTPFMRQAGFADWEKLYPNFTNWAEGEFRLDGHIGSHYLSALAFAYASTSDAPTKQKLLERLNYMVDMVAKAQSTFDNNKDGLYGYVGGLPYNELWTNLYKGNATFETTLDGKKTRAPVPFYTIHKMFAGLRDAYIYAGNQKAKLCFKKLCDWGVNLISNLSDEQLQNLLREEHGGINETFADAYKIFGDKKYLETAKRFSQREMVEKMQTLDTDFLSGKHANTQVPKYIGFERISQIDTQDSDKSLMQKFDTSAKNFWTDVAQNRTLSFGGNSVDEHFLHKNQGMRYIERCDGPESCNTNNMLKLSEMLFDATHEAKYADFYEKAMQNHILSTQNPNTGGYVYFTSVRPMHYRMYSQVNQGMWCCVGTGMENHGKYAHFIYTHDKDTLFVNLFVASTLKSKDFAIHQETKFPFEPSSKLIVGKSGKYTIAIRHPAWCKSGFLIKLNGAPIKITSQPSSYQKIERYWQKNDTLEISMPMQLALAECPTNDDYIAFTYGPVALGAIVSKDELERMFAGVGRMDHAPGIGKQWNLLDAPILLGERSKILSHINPYDISKLQFKIDASVYSDKKYADLILQPFFEIHEARYMLYWFQPSAQRWKAHKDMIKRIEDEKQKLENRTIDFVATGEQQSDAGHVLLGSYGRGEWSGEKYVDSWNNGWFSYRLKTDSKKDLTLRMRHATADRYRKCKISINDKVFKESFSPSPTDESKTFFETELPIPNEFLNDTPYITIKFEANQGTPNPGLYYLRVLSKE